MGTRTKLVLAGLAAALAMAVAVGSASANWLSVSHGNLLRAEWSSLELGAVGVVAVRCPVTLEGSFHSATFAKIMNKLAGYITRASVGMCATGHVTALAETLPWHIIYRGFRGTLPFITNVVAGIIGAAFRVSNSVTGECLMRTTIEHPAEAIMEEPVAEGSAGNRIFRTMRASEGPTIPCGGFSANFKASGNLRESPGGAVNVLVRLI